MHAALIEAASRLRQAERSGQPCAPVRDLIATALAEDPTQDPVALAYAVQRYNTLAAIDAGLRPVGHKIGLTSRAVQKQLGVDQPDFGLLFAERARGDGQPIAWDDTLQPKVEAEIALVLFNRAQRMGLDSVAELAARLGHWRRSRQAAQHSL